MYTHSDTQRHTTDTWIWFNDFSHSPSFCHNSIQIYAPWKQKYTHGKGIKNKILTFMNLKWSWWKQTTELSVNASQVNVR